MYCQQFPSLTSPKDDIFTEEGDNEDDILPGNPIEKNDAQIKALQLELAEKNSLSEEVLKLNASLKFMSKESSRNKKKLSRVKELSEKRLKECLPVETFESEFGEFLTTFINITAEDDLYDEDETNNEFKINEDFAHEIMKDFEDREDKETIKKRFDSVKNKLLDLKRKEEVALEVT